jgi:hypothetical protein
MRIFERLRNRRAAEQPVRRPFNRPPGSPSALPDLQQLARAIFGVRPTMMTERVKPDRRNFRP